MKSIGTLNNSPIQFCRIKSVFIILLFLLPVFTFARNDFSQKPDSNLVKQLLDSGYVMESINPQAALKIYAEANNVSKKIKYVLGQAKALHYSGIVYSDRSEYQPALLRYQEAMKLYRKIDYKRGIGACYTNMGNLFRYQGKLDSSLTYHQFAINFFKQSSQLDGLSMAYGNAGGIFQQLQQFEKAYNYFTLAVKAATQVNDSLSLCRALINQGTALNDLKKYDESIQINNRALQIAELLKDDYGLQLTNINSADYYKKKKQYAKAIQFGLKGLHYALKLSTPYDVADIKKRLGDLYLANGNHDKARTFYLEAIEVSEEIKATEISAAIYTSLHKLYAEKEDFKPAYKYQTIAQQYQDSILGEKQLKIINELEVKYQSLQKNNELAKKQLQLEKSWQYIIYSIGAFLIALLVVLILYLYYNYKRKIYDKQLKAVQQEKEIQVLQAWMQGEEKERTRIARDLHDEVAGMLAAAKMHMNSLVLQAQEIIQHKGYHQVVDLLNEASVSVRKTAHNLMPEVLMQHGLDKALCRFCTNISNDKLLVVQYDSWGDMERFAPNFELSVYRIVQELLNNIIKHAQASETLVQLSCQDQVLSITIEDNGIGFDPENISKSGTGMSSIKSRVHALQGKIDILSEIGKGASIYLEFETAMYAIEAMYQEKAVS